MNVVYQTSENDCGLAVLAMLLAHHGRHLSLYELKMRHPISTAGMSVLDLKLIARSYGLDCKVFAVQGDAAQLAQLATPFIAHWGGQHFTVVTRIADGKMHLADPRDGKRVLSIDEARKYWSGVALFMTPGESFQAHAPPTLLRQWLPEVRRFSRMLVALFFLSVLLLGLSYAVPLLISKVVSNFMEHGTLPFGTAGMVAVALGFVLSYYVFNWSKQALLLEIRLRLDGHLSERFSESLFRLPFLFFSRMPFGDLLERLGSVGTIREFISARIAAAIVDAVLVVTLAVLIFVTNHKLGIIYLGAVAIIAQLVYLQWPRLRERFRDEVLSYTASFDTFSDALLGIQDIKANHTEQVFYLRWRERFRQYLGTARARGRLTAKLEALLAVLGGGIPLVILLASLWLVNRAQLSPADAILAYLLIQYSMSPLAGLLGTGIMIQHLVIHTDRVNGITQFVADTATETPEQGSLPVTRIVVEDCAFSYAPDGRDVLSGVNLDITPGGFVILTGVSGSGKSTLLKLLTRTLSPHRGRVRYFSGEREIAPGGAVQLTSIIQDAAMFRGTVLENITLFDAGISLERVGEAARIANIHAEIMAMPLGFSTPVERGGGNLSGGQRQRLALARALLKSPQMLVLDEFTSHLDADNEARIIANLRQLGCTVIIATHRTAWIHAGDRIVQVRDATAHMLPAREAAPEACLA
jgi:ATP-binding cassette, subfamily B, bacterial